MVRTAPPSPARRWFEEDAIQSKRKFPYDDGDDDDDDDDNDDDVDDGNEKSTHDNHASCVSVSKNSNSYDDPTSYDDDCDSSCCLSANQDPSAAMKDVLDEEDIMCAIFTFLPIEDQVWNKLVCKDWLVWNTKSIEASPKKAFETNEELRHAILAYCNQEGYFDKVTGHGGWRIRQGLRLRNGDFYHIPAPTSSKRQMISDLYGSVINSWNVSEIETFDNLFEGCTNFDDDISSWNTSKAKSMRKMFCFASSFNQPLNNWITSNVEDMQNMFKGASSFNHPIGMWDTSAIENPDHMPLAGQ